MLHRLSANLVLLLHFAFVLIAVFGAFGVLLDPRWAWIHVPVVVWSSVVNLAGWTCPLTPLENRFRAAAHGAGYEGGFVQHYIGSVVYPQGMPRRLELVAGVSVAVWNAVLYTGLWVWLSRGTSGH
ncbi:MAG: DUF2784 domain-containing protein [Betaproteobacteria bacterium]|nr:DUF2784 domain-containing protein [Betaproteobacteria bacterium]MCC7216232.1 DUF2784 domain-containing protein [Burkholderiales bacterium]